MSDPDVYSPDPLVEQLEAVVKACLNVGQVKDRMAKRLLLEAIEHVVFEMAPIEFTPEAAADGESNVLPFAAPPL